MNMIAKIGFNAYGEVRKLRTETSWLSDIRLGISHINCKVLCLNNSRVFNFLVQQLNFHFFIFDWICGSSEIFFWARFSTILTRFQILWNYKKAEPDSFEYFTKLFFFIQNDSHGFFPMTYFPLQTSMLFNQSFLIWYRLLLFSL